MPSVRLERGGLFGAAGVVDTADARRFTIGGVLQGASLLSPSAATVEPSLPLGPGPVIETRYQLAWFLAGQRHASGHCLMLGLGGGCGAVGLLHQFPDMVLDAVDADPTMTAMAREFHPLVGHYERQGRLRLHLADAGDYLAQSSVSYDFAIVDLVVDGGDGRRRLNSLPLIQALVAAAPEIWFRMFGSLPDGEIHPILDKFVAAGSPVDWLFSPVGLTVPLPKMRDWILATGVSECPDAYDFRPYQRLRGHRIASVQDAYAKLASRVLSAADAELLRPGPAR